MAEEQFTITYKGNYQEGGRVSVRDLAPSLIGLADSISRASQLIDPESPEPNLEITAWHEGSFIVDLILSGASTNLPHARDWLLSPNVLAAESLSVIVGGVFGAFKYLKSCRGKRIQGKTPIPGNKLEITLDDGLIIIIPKISEKIAEDYNFQKSARAVLEPIARDTVEEIQLHHADAEDILIKGEDIPGFEPPSERHQVSDTEAVMTLQPLSVWFRGQNKWKFYDGVNTFSAKLEDEAFQTKIALGLENFVATDIFICKVRTITWQHSNGTIESERTILEVIDHQHGITQLTFDDI